MGRVRKIRSGKRDMGRLREIKDREASSRVTATTILACGHSIQFPGSNPSIGDVVWCKLCNKGAVVESVVANYAGRCNTCKYSRTYATLSEARRAASRHIMAHPLHKMVLRHEGKVIDTITQHAGQGSLPFDSELRDRLAKATEHQGSLRRLDRKSVV